MKQIQRLIIGLIIISTLALTVVPRTSAQDAGVILAGAELTRVVPPGFYYEGLSAPTQMRNAAAARFGRKHLVIVGMVDTSGYSTDVQAKYQGFFITDAPISFGDGSVLGIGAYGYGFVGDKLNILDVAGNQMLSIQTSTDRTMLRPRPLAMTGGGKEPVRLYAGRNYVDFQPRVDSDL
jgi:hypothetical protein